MQLFPQSDEHTDTVFSKPYMSFTGAVPVWDYLPKQEPTMNTMHDEENLILFNTQGVMTVHPKNAIVSGGTQAVASGKTHTRGNTLLG